MAKVKVSNIGYRFYCPACKESHFLDKERWAFNGDTENPTFTPNIRKRSSPQCHSMIRDGKIQFMIDSEHELAGQVMELPNVYSGE